MVFFTPVPCSSAQHASSRIDITQPYAYMCVPKIDVHADQSESLHDMSRHMLNSCPKEVTGAKGEDVSAELSDANE